MLASGAIVTVGTVHLVTGSYSRWYNPNDAGRCVCLDVLLKFRWRRVECCQPELQVGYYICEYGKLNTV